MSRKPHRTIVKHFKNLQDPRTDWHAAFLAWAQAQLEAHRSVAPLALNDPRGNALAQLQAPILERTFSTRLLANSKRFEELEGGVISVLRRFDPEASVYRDDDRALVRARHLERVPEYVPLAGALVLSVEGHLLDLSPFMPSVALSAAMLRVARVHACPVHTIVTVENATSFSELLFTRMLCWSLSNSLL